MRVAGIQVRDELALELPRLVDDPVLAGRLEDAYGDGVQVVGLAIGERETIL